jgi:hypothetical protein
MFVWASHGHIGSLWTSKMDRSMNELVAWVKIPSIYIHKSIALVGLVGYLCQVFSEAHANTIWLSWCSQKLSDKPQLPLYFIWFSSTREKWARKFCFVCGWSSVGWCIGKWGNYYTSVSQISICIIVKYGWNHIRGVFVFVMLHIIHPLDVYLRSILKSFNSQAHVVLFLCFGMTLGCTCV